MTTLKLTPGQLDLSTLRTIFNDTEETIQLALEADSLAAIKAARKTVDDLAGSERAIYGLNTGFGLLAHTRIDAAQLEELQHNIVTSHASGVGPALADAIVRLILLLKINSLACGHSGIRLEVVEALIALFNNKVYPVIPEKGSVGASGDLAPLAHLSLLLLGEGEAHVNGERLPARQALACAGLAPMRLAAKEGLALLNGTQVSTALALYHLLQAEQLFSAALAVGALSVDAAKGSDAPFDARIHQVRRHTSQQEVAAQLRELLSNSPLRESHRECKHVQDPYSLRCQPQVMGACLQNLRHAATVLVDEANAVTDNPLVFADESEILSGGNFHAEPVAMVADLIAICLSEIGAISERRIALLIDPAINKELPAFLVKEPGVNSGFMLAQVTATALASENKTLAHPASIDSLPTSANQEDHVSMATFAARRLGDILENVAHIIAIEWLAACQGIDLRAPLVTSSKLQPYIDLLRNEVPSYDQDRFFAPDIEKARKLLRKMALLIELA